MPSFSEFLFGSRDKLKKQNRLTDEGFKSLQDFFTGGGIESNPLFNQGNDFLMKLLSGDPEMMSEFQQPYLNEFNQQTIPGLAEQFAGLGGTSSSGFNNSITQAASGLQSNLAALRGKMQQEGLSQALGFASKPYEQRLGALSIDPYQFFVQGGSAGNLGPLLQSAIEAAGKMKG